MSLKLSQVSRGFALPTVLIASIVMMVVLLSAVQVTVATRSMLDSQYYSKLAQQAADSGSAYAQWCLHQNNNLVTWSNNNKLRPNTDCYGAVNGSYSSYVLESGNVKTSFEVGIPSGSGTIICSPGFILIPGNSNLGTSDFCAAKYEIKDSGGGVPLSQAAGVPWVTISQTAAAAAAQSMCSDCHLMTEAEWLTIAHNVAGVASNWVSGTIGSGLMYRGHTDSLPNSILAADVDTNPYNGTGQGAGSEQRRTFTLSNGEVIWDFSGNVMEMTGQVGAGKPGVAGGGEAWRDWNAVTVTGTMSPNPFPSFVPIAGSGTWNRATNGIGGVYSNSDDSATKTIRRGGHWTNGSNAGVFSIAANTLPTDTYNTTGFRAATTGIPSNPTYISASGKVELQRTTGGTIWRSYSHAGNSQIGNKGGFSNVFFGYNMSDDATDSANFYTIAANGKLQAVGGNAFGQLGVGNTTNSVTPRDVLLPAGKQAKAVYTGFFADGYNAYIVTTDGNLYAMGENDDGALGDGTLTNRSTPVKVQYYNGSAYVDFASSSGKHVKQVAVMGHSTIVLTEDGNIYSAGACGGENELLGRSCSEFDVNNRRFKPVTGSLPTPNVNDPSTMPVKISVEYRNVFVILGDGRLFGWGWNFYGQLAKGNDGDGTSRTTPAQIGTYGNSGQPKAIQAVCDGDSLWVVDDSGVVKSSGRNDYGQLGLGNTTQRNTFGTVTMPGGSGSPVALATDQWTTVILTNTGNVYSMGLNASGQIGDGATYTNKSSPTKLALPSLVTATKIYTAAAGVEFGYGTNYQFANTFVVGSDGKVYAVGDNEKGQLGRGSTSDRSNVPTAMNIINGTTIKAKDVKVGYGTGVILTEDGKVYTVGNNSNGQLGDGTTTNNSTPAANQYTNIRPFLRF